MHLLVFRFSAMGDVALVAPVLKNLLKNNARLHITFVSRQGFKPFFYGIERLNFVAADLSGRHKGILGMYRLFYDLRNENTFDAVVDLHDVMRTWLLSAFFFLTGLKISRINKGRAEKKKLVRQRNKVFKPLKHSRERYFDAFLPLGLYGNMAEPEYINPSPEGGTAVERFKQTNALGDKKTFWIAIAPFARHDPKMWPLANIATLIQMLSEKLAAKIFLFGGGEEEVRQLTALQSAYPYTINVSNQLSLQEGLALLPQLDLMVSMDSSNMHMATLSGIKVISIWGPTHPYAGFGALYQPDSYAIQVAHAELPCRPCSVFGDKVCACCQHDCMKKISPEHVFENISKALM